MKCKKVRSTIILEHYHPATDYVKWGGGVKTVATGLKYFILSFGGGGVNNWIADSSSCHLVASLKYILFCAFIEGFKDIILCAIRLGSTKFKCKLILIDQLLYHFLGDLNNVPLNNSTQSNNFFFLNKMLVLSTCLSFSFLYVHKWRCQGGGKPFDIVYIQL